MNSRLFALRLFIATAIGISVFFLSVLAGWLRSPNVLMINMTLDSWTHISLRTVDVGITHYIDEHGAPPKSLHALEPSLGKQTFGNSDTRIFKNGIPIDGWGRPLLYSVQGTSYTLMSYGRDGLPGGTLLDQDQTLLGPYLELSEEIWASPPMPTLRQYLFELPTKWMIISCALSGVIAFLLSAFFIRPAPLSKREVKDFTFRIAGLILASVIFALMIMGLHVPSGH